MPEDIKILAVTRMENNFCVAGVNQLNTWKRPVRIPGYSLLKNDIFQGNTCILKKYNIVRFSSLRQLNDVPHSEDFQVNWSNLPSVIGTINPNDFLTLFPRLDETHNIPLIADGIRTYLILNNRSLIMVRPSQITNCTWHDPYKGFKTRIRFDLNHIPYDISCTDLCWRAYMRINENHAGCVELLNTSNTYFTIGLTRAPLSGPLQGQIFPIIAGVHVIPDLNIAIDYNNL